MKMTAAQSRPFLLWLAGLVMLVALAWCQGTGRSTPADWNTPSQYADGYYGDIIFELARIRATAAGDATPLAWKNLPRLGAPFDGDWNDWPLIEEIPVFFWGMLAQFFGLFAGLNIALLIGHLLAALTF